MVMHMDQDRVHLNGQNGHTHNGHKNLEDLHVHLLDEYQTETQTQTRKVDYP